MKLTVEKSTSGFIVSQEMMEDIEAFTRITPEWFTPEWRAQRDAEHQAWARSWRGRVQRFAVWLDYQRPRVHRGPCPESEDS